MLTAAGIRIIKTPVQAPRANAERWIVSARRECPDRMLITGERHLRLVLDEYTGHCNTRRRHRALRQGAPARRPHPPDPGANVRVLRRDRPGGLIHEYSRSHEVMHYSAPTSPTGTAVVIVADSGENAITVAPGATAAVTAEALPALLHSLPAGILVTCFELPVAAVREAAWMAAGAGWEVILNRRRPPGHYRVPGQLA